MSELEISPDELKAGNPNIREKLWPMPRRAAVVAISRAYYAPGESPAEILSKQEAEKAKVAAELEELQRLRDGILAKFPEFAEFSRTHLSIRAIIKVVAEHYSTPPLEIISSRRAASVVIPRHVAIYLSRVLTTHSFPEIGRRFGGRDHTTALYAARKIQRLLDQGDAALAADIEAIKSRLAILAPTGRTAA